MSTTPSASDLLVHAGFVRGIAHAALRGDGSVDDVVQETWLAALTNGPRSERSARPWLARVARNLSFGTIRSERRRTAREQATARTATVPSTATIAEREETRRRLLDALMEVTEPSRSALVLRYYEDLPPREVAKRLGVPVETARTRIKRGLVQLRAALDASYDGQRKQWALALIPLTGTWARTTSSALGVKALIGAAGATAALAVVIATGVTDSLIDEDIRPQTQASRATTAATLQGAPQPPNDPTPGRSVAHGRISAVGQPVAARVTLRNSDEVLASTNTTDNGSYRFEGVTPGDLWIEMASEPAVRHRTSLRVDGQHIQLNVDLPSTQRQITGTMTYVDGRPYRGTVEMYGATESPTFITSTNATGEYHFPRVPDTLIRVTAKIPDRLTVMKTFAADATSFDLVLDKGWATYQGRVLEELSKSPIQGVRVHTSGLDTDRNVRVDTSTLTTADGSFAAHGFRDKPIQFSHTDYPQGVTGRGPNGTHYMRAAGRVHGVVRGPDGTSIVGARVVAMTFGSHATRRRESLTDTQGRYDMAVVPGQVAIYAYSAQAGDANIAAWQPHAMVPGVFTLAAGKRVERDITLRATGTLSGAVVDDAGQPIEGALIELQHKRDGGMHQGVRLRNYRTASGADGSFVLPGLIADVPYQVQASRFDYPSARADTTFTVAAGEQARTQIRLERARTGVITVRHAKTGDPVPGVTITLGRRKSALVPESGTRISCISDADGVVRFTTLSCLRLVWEATRLPSGYVEELGFFPLTAADAGTDFETAVEVSPAMVIAGRVSAPTGVSLKDASVDAEGIDENYSAPDGGARVQADGTFSFVGLPSGAYRISMRLTRDHTVYVAQTIVRTDQDDIVLLLRDDLPEGEWRIRVRAPSGKPARARITRVAKDIYTHSASAWGDVAQFEALGSDTQSVYVLVATPVAARTPDHALGAVVLGPFSWEGREIDVTLPPGRVLDGSISFPDGRPLANARLSVVPLLSASIGALKSSAQRVETDEVGRFRLRGLGALPYQVLFETQPDGWTPAPIRIEADAADAHLRLPDPPASISVTVRTPQGRPASGAHINVFALTNTERTLSHATARADGVAVLRGLTPGTQYHLWVHTVGKASASYEETHWTAAATTLKLVAELPFEGVIKDPRGVVLRRVRLFRKTAMGRWSILNKQGGPRFAVRMPPGRHRIQVVPYQQSSADVEGMWVTAGTTNAELTFDAGPALRVAMPGTPLAYASLQREGTPFEKTPWCDVDAEGIIEIFGLDADATYTLWASPDRNDNNVEQGVCLFRTGLRADGVLRTYDEWSPSVPVTGTVRVPAGFRPEDVRLKLFVAGMSEWVLVKSDGTFRARGVPPGRWKLVAQLGPKDKPLRVEVPTNGSEPVEIVFE